jgi:hypothetical protein
VIRAGKIINRYKGFKVQKRGSAFTEKFFLDKPLNLGNDRNIYYARADSWLGGDLANQEQKRLQTPK